MALEIQRANSTPVGGVIADRRLSLTADRSRVVEADDVKAAFLFATPGTEISKDAVEQYQLAVSDGKVVLKSVEPEAAEPPPDESTAKPAPKAKKKGADL